VSNSFYCGYQICWISVICFLSGLLTPTPCFCCQYSRLVIRLIFAIFSFLGHSIAWLFRSICWCGCREGLHSNSDANRWIYQGSFVTVIQIWSNLRFFARSRLKLCNVTHSYSMLSHFNHTCFLLWFSWHWVASLDEEKQSGLTKFL
jgi:hypothetical protein